MAVKQPRLVRLALLLQTAMDCSPSRRCIRREHALPLRRGTRFRCRGSQALQARKTLPGTRCTLRNLVRQRGTTATLPAGDTRGFGTSPLFHTVLAAL